MFDVRESPETWDIADYLLAESRERGDILTPLKLQKLIFYADAWHMALHDAELTPERFQAWVHGPVALSQWHRFKENRWRPILDEVARPKFCPKVAQHLNEIIDVFGSESATALEIMTHQEKPWRAARGDLPEDAPSNAYISKLVTKEFYKSVAEENT